MNSSAQLVDPFAIRHQTTQKGGIAMMANVAISCNGCSAVNEVPPGGNGRNNSFNQTYVDIDNDFSTFMSSSDQLGLGQCAEITWAGLYWHGMVPSNPPSGGPYTERDQVKLKVGSGNYIDLTADEILSNTVNKRSYYCFKDITSIMQSNTINSECTVANVYADNGFNKFAGWTIVVVYNDIYETAKNLTVFDGLANVTFGGGANVVIPLSGFSTPPSGPVSFELGVVAHDGDRNDTGDQLQFNGAGNFVNISDPIHPVNDLFNSTISNSGVLTPNRNPNLNNTLGFDANIFSPNNLSGSYIGNSATTADIRIISSSESILTSVITSAIEVYEPDLRSSVSYTDLNGGTISPGDILEFEVTIKNIGSDNSVNTIMANTLDPRLTYVPNSLSVDFGPNTGAKTDAIDVDQGEYIAGTFNYITVRIGTGADGTNGGTVLNSSNGADSTVITFQAQLSDDCFDWLCGDNLINRAFVTGTGQISGITNNNNGASDVLDASGCPTLANSTVNVDLSSCADTLATFNDSLCEGETLNFSILNSSNATYSWTGPNGFSSSANSFSIPNVTLANAGNYEINIDYEGETCISDTINPVFISENPVIQLNSILNDSCHQEGLGSIDISSTGNSPFQYNWSNGSTNSLNNNISAGNYIIDVTDVFGCVATDTFQVTEPPLLTSTMSITSDYNGQDISCFGASDASVEVIAGGGVSPYSYSWNTSVSTTNSLTNVDIGYQTVTITDQNNCILQDSILVTQPDSLVLSVSPSPILCFGDATGSIDLGLTGGTSTFNYAWSNGATTQDINGLLPGTYSTTVTDINGCSDTISTVITQPLDSMTITFTKVDVLCNGDATGAIDLSVTGGNGNYSYAWSSGQTTEDLSGITAGSYTVTVTDNNNCSQNLTIEILEPAALVITETNVDVLCFSDSTGSIDLTVSGGVLPYTYSWSNGDTTQDLTNIPAGSYTVTVTDSHNCVSQETILISQPTDIVLSATTVDVLCYDFATGEIDLTPTGGVLPYTYNWSNGSNSQDLTNLPDSIYEVLVTDNNGCQDSLSAAITQPIDSMTITAVVTDVACFGDSTGSIDLSVSGGIGSLSYLWDTGATTQDVSGLPIGDYLVTVTDSNECSQNLVVNIAQPSAPLALSETHIDPACIGGTQGSIDLSVAGGTPGYTYLWNNAQTTQDIMNLNSGTYSVLVTDTLGCTDTISVDIIDPSAVAPTLTQVDILCHGDSTGAIDLSVTGGTPGYTYTWSNGATTQDISSLPEGNYFVDVFDANNCGAFISTILTEPSAPLSLTDSIVNNVCFDYSEGDIFIDVAGGTPGYTYLWSNGDTTSAITDVESGIYDLLITDSNGCTLNYTDTIIEPAELIMSESQVNVSCFGDSTGSIDITTIGGVTPYSYSWSHGPTTEDVNQLPANAYTVIATDSNACLDTLDIIITEPFAPLATTETNVDILCFGDSTGSIDLNVTGGTPGYSYSWSNSDTLQDLSSLPAGTYTVTVTDTLNCQTADTVIISEPPLLSLSTSPVDVLCFGFSTGAIDLTPQGGVTPYAYNWSNGEITQDISSLLAGSYQVIVTDNNNCVDSITTVVTQPADSMTITASIIDVSCFGDSTGSIDLSVIGGTAPYSYVWDSGQTTEDLSGIPTGIYTVTVTDDNNCVQFFTAEVTQPSAPIALTNTNIDVLCFGDSTGAIDLNTTGGTAPYSYLWSSSETTADLSALPAGSYTVIVTDTLGCIDSLTTVITEPAAPLSLTTAMTPVICFGDSTGTISVTATGGTPGYSYLWDTGDTTANVSGLPIGTYSVEVTDTNGCSDTASIVVTEPTQLTGQISHVDVLCHGESTGSVSTVISGGITPYSYAWNNGDVTANITTVPAGPYEVFVTDDNGCTITLFDTILEPAAPITSSININQNLCFGDSLATVDLTVQGGVGSYTYSWSTGDTTEDLSGLPAGDYIVLITDTNACTLLDTAFVTHPDLITATEVIENVSCFGFSDGAIDITPVGGTGAYTYSWSTGATTQDVSGLPAGNYSATITDVNNCSQSFNYTITEPDPLNAVYSLEMPDCFDFSNGSLTPQVTGGTTPYTYNWDNGVNTAINDQIPTGDYTLTITDDNGCIFELECFLPEPPELQVSFTVDTTAGCEPVELNFSNTSDENIVAYQWNFGDGSFGSGSDISHTYFDVGCKDVTLTITDVNNCSNSVTYQDYVCIYRTPTAALEASPDQLFSGIAETTVSNLSMDATSYIWDMGDATGLYTFFEPGLYTYPDFYLEEYTITLTAISEVGCRDTASIDLNMDNEPIIYVPNTFTPDGDQYNNTFKPVLPTAMEDYRLTIWNRWGEVLFESFDPAIGWDGTYGGKMVQDGTYIWTIRMQPPGVDKPVTKTGSVNVLR